MVRLSCGFHSLSFLPFFLQWRLVLHPVLLLSRRNLETLGILFMDLFNHEVVISRNVLSLRVRAVMVDVDVCVIVVYENYLAIVRQVLNRFSWLRFRKCSERF